MEHRHTWIVGAGLAGSLLACLLSKQGRRVSVSERRSSVELEQLAAGRSINLALAERGRYALELAGVVDQVLAQAVAMPGRQVHLIDGTQNFQPYAADLQQSIYSVHRARMNRTLLNAAKVTGAAMHFDERVLSIDLLHRRAIVQIGSAQQEVSFDFVIGADGAGSVVRDAIAEQHRNAAQGYRENAGGLESHNAYFDTLDHSYKELSIPPNADGGFQLNPNALHIWPRESFMLIALPNPDASFTATLFLQNQGSPSFSSIQDQANAKAFFEREFATAASLMPDYVDDLRDNPQGVLGTLRCRHWYWSDRAVILGDAAHAIVPFHGQGMNCAFEDCVVLAQQLHAIASPSPYLRPSSDVSVSAELEEVFQRFQNTRQPQAHAIAEMALENYIEMRDLVADADYRLRKKLEQTLAMRHPGWFVPRYELVSFSRYDYALARHRGQIQSEILQLLTEGKNALDQIDLDLADRLVSEKLPPLPTLASKS
jgi:kynurenine 3-monooxygenase